MLRAIRARYVFPVVAPPIADGVVVIDGQRLIEVAPANKLSSRVEIENLGNVAILPGLVNAHTHLEFSDLEQPLGSPGMIFPHWIRAVIAHRRASESANRPEDRAATIDKGLCESLQAGVTTIGDIAAFSPGQGGYEKATQTMMVFREWLGLSHSQASGALQEAANLVDDWRMQSPCWSLGLSPHAPYSTHIGMVVALARLAMPEIPLAMHLAESREELELLEAHGGPFRKLLDDLGVWNPCAIPQGARPLDYLKLLAIAPRALVIHGNYLTDNEIEFVAGHSETMSVVYCPRTHAYFQHEKYPLTKMRAAGVHVALGTDSRASNPDLSLLAEMRHVARHHDVPRDEVLRMGTLHGAKALGLDHEVGSIEPGKRADMAVVALPSGAAGDPHQLLFDSDLPSVATYCGSRLNAPRQPIDV